MVGVEVGVGVRVAVGVGVAVGVWEGVTVKVGLGVLVALASTGVAVRFSPAAAPPAHPTISPMVTAKIPIRNMKFTAEIRPALQGEYPPLGLSHLPRELERGFEAAPLLFRGRVGGEVRDICCNLNFLNH